MRFYHYLLLSSLVFVLACPDPNPIVDSNWPPQLEGWSIAELGPLPAGIQNELNFFNIDEGIVFGAGIYFSDDGGRNWTERSPQADIKVDAISFQSYQRGSISFHKGDGSNAPYEVYIAQTDDAGQNWSVGLVNDFSVPLSDIHFIDDFEGLAIVAGQPNRLYRTLDSGATWDSLENVIPKISAFTDRANNQSIQFLDENIGFVLAADGSSWYKTQDAGETWARQAFDPFAVRAFQVLSEDSIYFLAERLYFSEDGGNSFELVSADIFDSFAALPNAALMGMRFKRIDASNPAQSLNFYTLSYREAGSNDWQESQEVVNYFFEAFVSTGPRQLLGLALDQQTAERTLYRLQK